MLRKVLVFIFILAVSSITLSAPQLYAAEASLSVLPATVIQGEPFMVQVSGVTDISSITKLTFDGKKVNIFMYQKKPTGLVAIDLYKKAGDYELVAEIVDGSPTKKPLSISKTVTVGKREKVEEPMGIPDKLGGNTTASQDKLVATLISDNKILASLRTNAKSLWTQPFIPPLKKIFITDPYGYSRQTGQYSIAHKGVDYRATIGTEVLATNRGVVRLTQALRNDGNTIVIDHGQGLQTFYLHLSKYKVKVGDIVKPGQVIGLSGDTGYTQGAHLHFSVRIDNVAIDPVKFLELFK